MVNKFNTSFFSLLLLSAFTSYIVIALFTKTLPLFLAKVVYFCQELATKTLFQIPHTLPDIIIFILSSAIVLGILSFLVQVGKTHRLVKRLLLKRISLSEKVEKIITRLGLKNKVYVVEDENLFSFCSGIFSPSIIITTGLISSLNDKELEAVFLHEKAHLQSRDPFKIILGKTISWVFFFLPIFSELNKNIVATNELLADRFVIKSQQDTAFLRGALKKILMEPQVTLATVPAIANPDYLEIRIHRLVNPALKQSFRISWKSIATSLLFFILSVFVLQTPVSAFSTENHKEHSYFICSSDNACRQECQTNVSRSDVTTTQDLFSSQVPQYKTP